MRSMSLHFSFLQNIYIFLSILFIYNQPLLLLLHIGLYLINHYLYYIEKIKDYILLIILPFCYYYFQLNQLVLLLFLHNHFFISIRYFNYYVYFVNIILFTISILHMANADSTLNIFIIEYIHISIFFYIIIFFLSAYLIYSVLNSIFAKKLLDHDIKKDIALEHKAYIQEATLLVSIVSRTKFDLSSLSYNMSFIEMSDLIYLNMSQIEEKDFTIKVENITNSIQEFATKYESSLYLDNKDIIFNKRLFNYSLSTFANLPTYRSSVISSNEKMCIVKMEYDFDVYDLKANFLDDIIKIKNILSYMNCNIVFVKNFIILELRLINKEYMLSQLFLPFLMRLYNHLNVSYSKEKVSLLNKLKKTNIPDHMICQLLSCDNEYIRKYTTEKSEKSF